ncbi:response regulator transcription factor [Modestobacter italicus]|uniref:response regulator transcription factor n=1 Tax=Modestobacter italicus (strain DSM 44449 / CECT 9708 / BC 501) TaxID=2732864 RepID=UPI0027E191E9|nr:response regulator transcription factor [Modestobacter italicus]
MSDVPQGPATGSGPVRVLLVDDQKLVRAGFTMIFGAEADLEVVGEACNGVEAIEVARRTRPDVILMDVQMPVMDGIEATRRITAEMDATILMLTTFDDEESVLSSLQAGASGFLLKNTDPAQLVHAVLAAAQGHALLAPEVTRQVIHRSVGPEATPPAVSADTQRAVASMTEREREVLGLVARGMSNAEIAAHLVVGEATVKTHVSSCLHKLQLRDRVKLVVFAFESGLVDQPPATRAGEHPTGP